MSRLIRQTKDRFWQFLCDSGAYRALRPWYGGVGSILTFHRIAEPTPAPRLSANQDLEVSPECLETIITHLRNSGYLIVSLDQLVSSLKEKSQTNRLVCFTFDDGYKDNFTVAYPIFKKHKIPFTVYVTTSFPDRTALLWWYALEELLLSQTEVRFTFQGKSHVLATQAVQDKEQAFTTMKAMLLGLTNAERVDFLNRLLTPYAIDINQYVERYAMTWEEIKTLHADPLVTIGAHTLTHPSLKRLEIESAREEMKQSKRILEEKLKTTISHFAYPFGTVETAGTREFQLVKELGFTTGVTSRRANIVREHSQHLECLPRLSIDANVKATADLDRLLCGYPLFRARQFERLVTI